MESMVAKVSALFAQQVTFQQFIQGHLQSFSALGYLRSELGNLLDLARVKESIASFQLHFADRKES
ncbi:hypothetical protein D3C84_617040 [compost metagenome]